jgi:hypothetical protein
MVQRLDHMQERQVIHVVSPIQFFALVQTWNVNIGYLLCSIRPSSLLKVSHVYILKNCTMVHSCEPFHACIMTIYVGLLAVRGSVWSLKTKLDFVDFWQFLLSGCIWLLGGASSEPCFVVVWRRPSSTIQSRRKEVKDLRVKAHPGQERSRSIEVDNGRLRTFFLRVKLYDDRCIPYVFHFRSFLLLCVLQNEHAWIACDHDFICRSLFLLQCETGSILFLLLFLFQQWR